jgi:hypothetical protein
VVPRCHSPPYNSLVTAITVGASEYLAYSLDFIPSDLKSERSNLMVCVAVYKEGEEVLL